MELNQLHYFAAVAKTENITKAAQELFITQPALSRVILRLEREIGTPLFDRSGGRLTLNAHGKVFLSYVQPALDAINDGVHAVQDDLDNREIILHNYLVTDLFRNIVERCEAKFPNFSFVVRNLGDNAEDIELQDVAPDIVMLPTDSFRSYVFPMSYKEHWCIIYNSQYEFRTPVKNHRITMEQLAAEPISFLGSHYDRQYIEKLFADRDLTPRLLECNSLSESGTQIKRCKAIGFVPVANFMSLYDWEADSPISAALISDADCSRMLYLGRSQRFLSNADEYRILEAIKNHLCEQYAKTDQFYENYFGVE